MKNLLKFCTILLILSFLSCDKKEIISPDAVDLSVDFTWEGMESCDWGNPEINISGLPDQTKFIQIYMYDNAYQWDHGNVTFPFTGSTVIERGKFRKIQGPCPPASPGSYEITIKALNEKKVVIAMGRKERLFPE